MASLTQNLGQALATHLGCVYSISHYLKKQKFGSDEIKAMISPLAFNIQQGDTRCGKRHSIDYYISIQALKQNWLEHFQTTENIMLMAGAINKLQAGQNVYCTKEVQNISTIDWGLIADANIIKSQIVIKMQVK